MKKNEKITRKNEKIVMLIEVVDFGHVPSYELYDDIAYGHKRYNELYDAGNIYGLNFVYIMEHMLKDYYAVWRSIDDIDDVDLYDACDLLHRRMGIELALLWAKLHR